jgi:cytochrome c oxidase cbb3-type subunit III
MSDEPNEDRLLEHEYDGIQEYDNPMPRWWILIFWATVVFAALYWLNVPGVGSGRGRIASYERDMAQAQERYGPRAPVPGSGPNDAQLIALAKDPAKRTQGKAVFETNCTPCHRADGGGVIGPNLTDDFWIHGGRPAQILNTIDVGVPDKGMPAWGAVLKPDEVAAVAVYVMSIHGTHPPAPKEPQGVKEEWEAAEAGKR